MSVQFWTTDDVASYTAYTVDIATMNSTCLLSAKKSSEVLWILVLDLK